MIYKRGKTYWYKFVWNGRRIRESAKTGNPRTARQIESAPRFADYAENWIETYVKRTASIRHCVAISWSLKAI